ncbi:MAG: nitroreductase family protein [Bacillota bacterium]|nr:nitroreductase family protein [Bacillota bacterium]
MTVQEAIRIRRSIRRYQSRELPAELLDQVLEAGRLAPSARNLQNWRFHVIRDAKLRQESAAACNGQVWIGEAPVVLVISETDNRLMGCGQPMGTMNASIAVSYMTLAAAEAGLGTCWIGSFKADELHKLLGLPEEETIVAVTPLGYPAESPEARPRQPREAIVIEH